MEKVNSILQQSQKFRRRFQRIELDAAIVALASGFAGAGSFVVAQGVLYFTRYTMTFPMVASAQVAILLNFMLGTVWLAAALTHFYPAALPQTQLDFARGVNQVPFVGLYLLFSSHLAHVVLRAYAFALFAEQFGWIIFAVLGFHFLFVLSSLTIARAFTRPNYTKNLYIAESSIKANILSDIMHSVVGVFEFTNAQARFTRTRYLLYYLLYYGENAGMLGAWYVHFRQPGAWFYLPSLLVVVIVQLLGFILLQTYLFLYSRARRKFSICGYCFAHRDPSAPLMHEAYQEGDDSRRSWHPHPSTIAHTRSYSAARSSSGRSSHPQGTPRYIDPVLGNAYGQAAIPRHGRRSLMSNTRTASNATNISRHDSSLPRFSTDNREPSSLNHSSSSVSPRSRIIVHDSQVTKPPPPQRKSLHSSRSSFSSSRREPISSSSHLDPRSPEFREDAAFLTSTSLGQNDDRDYWSDQDSDYDRHAPQYRAKPPPGVYQPAQRRPPRGGGARHMRY